LEYQDELEARDCPNGSADTATFALSNTTAISISANTELNGITFTAAATNPYTITANPGLTFTISGLGITNNSGIGQEFDIPVDASNNGGTIAFSNSATAGSNVSIFNDGGTINFLNMSTAGSATIGNFSEDFTTSPTTNFFNRSTASNSTIANEGGSVLFANNSTAGNSTIANEGGSVSFANNSTAGNSTIGIESGSNDGFSISFANNSSAGSAFIDLDRGSVLQFTDNSTAANSTIGTFFSSRVSFSGNSTAASASIGVRDASFLEFANNSTAGSATITSGGGAIFFDGSSKGGTAQIELLSSPFFEPSQLFFSESSTAGSATIINDGATDFSFAGVTSTFFGDTSTAGSATIIANGGPFGGGQILFGNNSTGGTSRIEVFGNGFLDISAHNAPGVTIGSIEGDGDAFLGANDLTVGSNNLSTTFSGVIQGVGGSLTKIGTGRLDLTGANTYTGNTSINRGVLKVDGSITSNTFVNHGGTLAGTGTISGDVMNKGTVSPGDAPGTLTINGNYTQASNGTLLIDIAGGNAGECSVLDVLGTANLSGLLDPVLLNGFVPTIGESFTFLNYGAVTGTLDIFDRNIDSLAEHWEVSYLPTSAILTVAAGNISVPDHGSTFLLLTLSLLGLATYRWRLLCRQA
jgi:autotransporter-associated beta strand protein